MTDPGTIISEAIDRKEGRQLEGKGLLLIKRVQFDDLLKAAQISIAEAERKNHNLESTLDELNVLLKDAAGSILEASELLEEQAQQLS